MSRLTCWRDETGIDGINLSWAVRPGSWEDFIALALPELRAQGIVAPARAKDAQPVTLRERIFPGHKRALNTHRASRFRNLKDAESNDE